ncbi:TPA: DUF859 family phage minor structural protein [Streptococcus suis]
MAIFRYSGNWRSYLEGTSSTVSKNIAGNSSVIKVDVWIGMDAGWSIEFGNTYGNSVTVNCDGQSKTISVGPLYLNGSKKYLGSVQFTVGHKPEGDKTAGISISSNMSNISYGSLSFGNASGSWSHVLPPIPRSSSISFSTGTIGSPLAITINRASTSFTHTLRWAWGSRSGTIASGLTTSASWTIPMDFCNEIPNNVSGSGTIYVDTYSGSTKIGTQSKQFTANVPSSVIPTFTGITLDDQNAIAKALITGNTFVQIMSDIKVTFNGASGIYNSTIKGFRAEVLNKNIILTSNGETLGPMNFNGTATIRASVTDSRGRVSATKDVTITLLEYYAPVISIQVLRTRENPNKLQVLRTIKVAPLTVGGVNKNSTKLVFEVAPLGSTSFVVDNSSAGGEWTTIFTLTNSEANLGGTYTSTSSWTVRAKLSDKFTSSNPTIASTNVGTEKVIHAYDKDGRLGVGKIPELGPAGSVDIAGNIYAGGAPIGHYSSSAITDIDKALTAGVYTVNNTTINQPFGISEWGYLEIIVTNSNTHNNSSNWIWQKYATTSGKFFERYKVNSNSWTAWKSPALDQYYPIGAIYQSTNNTNPSTFMGGTWERFGKGRVLVSVDENDSDFSTPNKIGGEKTHKLTADEMAHSHIQTERFNSTYSNAAGHKFTLDESVTSGTIKTSGVVDVTSQPHNNLQPYIAVYMWRRTA